MPSCGAVAPGPMDARTAAFVADAEAACGGVAETRAACPRPSLVLHAHLRHAATLVELASYLGNRAPSRDALTAVLDVHGAGAVAAWHGVANVHAT